MPGISAAAVSSTSVDAGQPFPGRLPEGLPSRCGTPPCGLSTQPGFRLSRSAGRGLSGWASRRSTHHFAWKVLHQHRRAQPLSPKSPALRAAGRRRDVVRPCSRDPAFPAEANDLWGRHQVLRGKGFKAAPVRARRHLENRTRVRSSVTSRGAPAALPFGSARGQPLALKRWSRFVHLVPTAGRQLRLLRQPFRRATSRAGAGSLLSSTATRLNNWTTSLLQLIQRQGIQVKRRRRGHRESQSPQRPEEKTSGQFDAPIHPLAAGETDQVRCRAHSRPPSSRLR